MLLLYSSPTTAHLGKLVSSETCIFAPWLWIVSAECRISADQHRTTKVYSDFPPSVSFGTNTRARNGWKLQRRATQLQWLNEMFAFVFLEIIFWRRGKSLTYGFLAKYLSNAALAMPQNWKTHWLSSLESCTHISDTDYHLQGQCDSSDRITLYYKNTEVLRFIFYSKFSDNLIPQ